MKPLTSAQTRQTFLEYFAKHGHQKVASSSLVPGNDPTLKFVNAGMVQFKDVFLGLDSRPYSRATTSQKCMRISGKHNDLENVGPSPRHHTFFEMLGNFSFGDYFKPDAIKFAHELLTKVYGVPEDRLVFTVFRDDDDAFNIWTQEVKVPGNRVYRMGTKTNFWQMAETGPCGPTSEVHYDWGKEACTCGLPNCSVELDNGCERWLEIWNLVFMQYNRTEPDPEHTHKFDQPLPKPGVDTGMGLERILAVLQNAKANYDTDLFSEIMDATQEVLGHDDAFRDEHTTGYRVIADHCRAATFLIADGVNPGTTGREYIARMIIRRAWRFAHAMGVDRPFLMDVSEAVIQKMRDVYPELEQFRESIKYQISAEESRFVKTLDRSLDLLDDKIRQMQSAKQTKMSGKDAFFLYSTHGLPMEITRDVLKELELTVNESEFEQELADHHGADEIQDGQTDVKVYQEIADSLRTKAIKYDPYDYSKLSVDTEVVALIVNGKRVKQANSGDEVEIVLLSTPFYVESGGQVSDTGMVSRDDWQITVTGMSKPIGSVISHNGVVDKGKPSEGDAVTASVDEDRRWDVMRNHTATHLLHASLRRVLGEHVRQKGSLVAPDRLRFDFTHNEPLTETQIDTVTEEVNRMILANRPVQTVVKPLDEAKREGAMALFGEKYGETVRTITISERGGSRFSYELCGGTHVVSTAEIGTCVITVQGSSGSGVRRITALTGNAAREHLLGKVKLIETVSRGIGVPTESFEEKVSSLASDLELANRRLEELSRMSAKEVIRSLAETARDVAGVKVIASKVSAPNAELLSEMADWGRDRLGSGVVVLGSDIGGKARFVVKISPDIVKRGAHAGKLVAILAKEADGGGGGRPDFATAGGNSPNKLDAAISKVDGLLAEAIQSG